MEEVLGAEGVALYIVSPDGESLVPAFLAEQCPPLFVLSAQEEEEIGNDAKRLASFLRLAKVPEDDVAARERIKADGSVHTPLDEAGLIAAAKKLCDSGVESIAIVFLHSYANPDHERAALAVLEPLYPEISFCVSCDVAPEIREYERASTTVANAYVKPLAERYLDALARKIGEQGIDATLLLMISSGGLTHVAEAKRVPVQMLESGPAAGALAGGPAPGAGPTGTGRRRQLSSCGRGRGGGTAGSTGRARTGTLGGTRAACWQISLPWPPPWIYRPRWYSATRTIR